MNSNRQNNTPSQCPGPNPTTCEYVNLMWQKAMKNAEEIKVDDHLILK